MQQAFRLNRQGGAGSRVSRLFAPFHGLFFLLWVHFYARVRTIHACESLILVRTLAEILQHQRREVANLVGNEATTATVRLGLRRRAAPAPGYRCATADRLGRYRFVRMLRCGKPRGRRRDGADSRQRRHRLSMADRRRSSFVVGRRLYVAARRTIDPSKGHLAGRRWVTRKRPHTNRDRWHAHG